MTLSLFLHLARDFVGVISVYYVIVFGVAYSAFVRSERER